MAIVRLNDRSMHIDLPSDFGPRLSTKVVALGGSPPEEKPRASRWLHLSADVRLLGPFTLRFRSVEAHDPFEVGDVQDGIKSTIWSTIHKLLEEAGLQSNLPRISFDVDDAGVETYGLLDLVFPSSEVYSYVRKSFNEIHIGWDGNEKHAYERIALTNSVGGDVFKIDCINISLDDASVDSLYLALSDLTSSIGSLLGIAKIVFTKAELVQDKYSGSLRLYVKLTRYWRAAPLEDLVASLPTFFKWHGVSHRLLYAGLDLHAKPAYSADYPLNTVGAASEPLTATSATQTPNESGGVSKKRKARGG